MAGFLKLALAAALAALVSAQAGPNTLAQYNPANRTMSTNSTYCILPISKADAKKIAGFAPLDVPKDVLPSFPAGMHPLIITSGYVQDIRMTALNLVPLQIESMMSGSANLPYIDVTRDGKTPITFNVGTYIGGTSGNDLAAIVPALAAAVSPFEGTNTSPAEFDPDTAAAVALPGGVFSTEVKPFLVPNPISGPGVVAEAFDMLFRLTTKSPYTAHTFHALLNNPLRLNNGLCQRNTLYFNQTFTDPKMAVGNVTLYHQIFGGLPAQIDGPYTNVQCYTANAVEVGALGESCSAAAAEMDPASRV